MRLEPLAILLVPVSMSRDPSLEPPQPASTSAHKKAGRTRMGRLFLWGRAKIIRQARAQGLIAVGAGVRNGGGLRPGPNFGLSSKDLRGPSALPGRNLVLPALLFAALPAEAQSLAPPSWAAGDATIRLSGDASGALFQPDQPGWSGTQASGVLRVMPQLRRDYDSGLSLALDGTFAAADSLSRGRYDGDVIERLSGSARTGLGTLEIGLTDGAGYALAVTG